MPTVIMFMDLISRTIVVDEFLNSYENVFLFSKKRIEIDRYER